MYVAVVVPIVTVTVLSPSSPDATKSEPDASATSRFTVRSAAGAGSAVTVNAAPVPSATGDAPRAMVTTGAGDTVVKCTSASWPASAQALSEYAR